MGQKPVTIQSMHARTLVFLPIRGSKALAQSLRTTSFDFNITNTTRISILRDAEETEADGA